MSSISEKGHTKNVANFGLMISYVKEMGVSYNPINPKIAITAMTATEAAAQAAMSVVMGALIAQKNAVNERDAAYALMSKIATKVISALAASGVPADIVKDARGIVRKITGKRTSPKPAPDPNNPGGDPVSSSQMSYDNRKANFDLLIALVKGQTAYNPNEVDIKVTALEAYAAGLQPLNVAVNNANAALDTKRDLRNEVLYGPDLGISDIATKVKTYVKSVVGGQSPVYKRIAAIIIRKPSNM